MRTNSRTVAVILAITRHEYASAVDAFRLRQLVPADVAHQTGSSAEEPITLKRSNPSMDDQTRLSKGGRTKAGKGAKTSKSSRRSNNKTIVKPSRKSKRTKSVKSRSKSLNVTPTNAATKPTEATTHVSSTSNSSEESADEAASVTNMAAISTNVLLDVSHSDDVARVCETGSAGDTCGAGKFCELDACTFGFSVGAVGICAEKPAKCTRQYDPACGCDGRTYANACIARSLGVSVFGMGACDSILALIDEPLVLSSFELASLELTNFPTSEPTSPPFDEIVLKINHGSMSFTYPNPVDLVTTLLQDHSDIEVRNVTATSPVDGLSCWAAFDNGHSAGVIGDTGEYLLPDQGVIMSTGQPANFNGNDSDESTYTFVRSPTEDTSIAMLLVGDDAKVYDPCTLQFDFRCPPAADSASLDFVFGSEEYYEYVSSEQNYNDAFGVFLNGGENMALVPGSEDVVAINTINGESHSEYFVRNDLVNVTSPFPYIEADGFTKKMSANSKLNEGWNTIKVVIADVGDATLDSWVLLEANSFSCGKMSMTPNVPSAKERVSEQICGEHHLVVVLP